MIVSFRHDSTIPDIHPIWVYVTCITDFTSVYKFLEVTEVDRNLLKSRARSKFKIQRFDKQLLYVIEQTNESKGTTAYK